MCGGKWFVEERHRDLDLELNEFETSKAIFELAETIYLYVFKQVSDLFGVYLRFIDSCLWQLQ